MASVKSYQNMLRDVYKSRELRYSIFLFDSSTREVPALMMVQANIQVCIISILFCVSVGYARAPKKIIEGHQARIAEFPHQVSLQDIRGHFCGGTIIDGTHILTAAHCLVNETLHPIELEGFIVVTGTNDVLNVTSENTFFPIEIFVHENFSDSMDYVNDIAILKLNKPIPFNDYQKPAQLPNERIPDSRKVMLSGWGDASYDRSTNKSGDPPRYLQKLETTILNRKRCEEMLEEKVFPQEICTISTTGSGDCFGDSGGPITYQGAVVGVVSWGYYQCAAEYPDVHTRVHEHLGWINEILSL